MPEERFSRPVFAISAVSTGIMLLLGMPSGVAAAVTTYSNRATFAAASTNLQTIDFESLAPPGDSTFYGNPGLLVLKAVSFTTRGNDLFVQSKNYYNTGAFLSAQQGASPVVLNITLPAGITALGGDFQVSQAIVTLSTGDMLTFNGQPFPSLVFFGVTSTVPITSVSFQVGSGVDLDNFSFGQGATPARDCIFTLPPNAPYGYFYDASGSGGSGAIFSFSLSFTATPSTCSWTASSDVVWLTITAPVSGIGSSNVKFVVAANTSSVHRAGNIILQSGTSRATFQIYQNAATCSFQATPISLSFSAQGGSSTVTVTANAADCQWLPFYQASWITGLPALAVIGTGQFSITVAANPGPDERMATLSVYGSTISTPRISLSQVGVQVPSLFVNPASLSFSYQQGGSPPAPQNVSVSSSVAPITYTVTASGGDWLSVAPTTGTTPGTVRVSAAGTGLSPATYRGSIIIAGAGATNSPQTVNVSLQVLPAPPAGPQSGGGPAGGFITSIVFDRTNSTTVYLGTGGGVFKSSNGGQSWSAVLRNRNVWALAINPASPTTVYAAVLGGVLKSVDAGQNWTDVSTGITNANLRAVVIDPAQSSTIYAATDLGGGVFKSTNGGQSWVSIDSGLTSLSVYALAIGLSGTLYAGTPGGVFRSTNGGGSWSLAGLPNASINVLVIDPTGPNEIYAGTNKGVFKSSNDGQSWTNLSSSLTNSLVLGLAISSAGTLYAGTFGGGTFVSSNGGQNWTTVNAGLTDTFLLIRVLAADPVNSGTIYLGSQGGGVFRSTNGGQSWSAVNSGVTAVDVYALAIDPANSNTLFTGTNGGGVFKSTAAGQTWFSINSGLVSSSGGRAIALVVDPTISTTLYAGTLDGGLFKSTDGGQNWIRRSSIGPVQALTIDRLNTATLYAGTFAEGVFKSTDAGQTWFAVNTGITNLNINVLAADPNNSNTVYTGTSGGVFKSINGGQSWTTVLPNQYVSALAIDRTTSSVIYAGAFKSTDGGRSWVAIGVAPFVFAIDPSNSATVYAGASNGVFRSTDGGQNWNSIKTGLVNTDVRTLAIDSANPAVVYAGTFGGGVFKSTNRGTTWQPTGEATSLGPAPSIASVSPTSGTQGQTITNFTVTGTNFQTTSTLSFSGTGISVNSYSSRTTTRIAASIAIAADAPIGLRDVSVANTDSQQATLASAFQVLASQSINISAVLNGASFAPGMSVAPGSIAAVFGTGLASSTGAANGAPLPTTLAGATLRFNRFLTVLTFTPRPHRSTSKFPGSWQAKHRPLSPTALAVQRAFRRWFD